MNKKTTRRVTFSIDALKLAHRTLCSGAGVKLPGAVSDQEPEDKHELHSNLPVHDVAIVGGGMVGMALPCSLAHQPLTNQLNVAIIDSNPALISSDHTEKEDPPDPRVSTVTPATIGCLKGVTYPPKMELESRVIPRAPTVPHFPSSPEPSGSVEGSDPKRQKIVPDVTTPNDYFFHTSVLKNTTPSVGIQYMQGLCPNQDRAILAKQSHEKKLDDLALNGSKFLVNLADIMANAQGGFQDPSIAQDLAREKAKSESLRTEKCLLKSRLEAASKEASEKTKKFEEKAKELHQKSDALDALQAKFDSEVSAAEARGRENFLSSEVGLSVVQRIRRVTKRNYVHSESFVDVVTTVVSQYGEYLLDKFKEWLAEGKSLEDFPIDEVWDNAPDVSELKVRDECTFVTQSSDSEFLRRMLEDDRGHTPSPTREYAGDNNASLGFLNSQAPPSPFTAGCSGPSDYEG